MTVTTQTKKVTATGNGSATTFSFSPIVIFASTDIVVTTTVIATGVETTLSEGSSSSTYSVGITTYPATGSITYPASGGSPLASTHTITIKRVLTLEQQTDLNNQGGYFPDTQETQFDKLLMIDLQQQDDIARALKFPVSYTGSVVPEMATPVAGGYLLWNATADAIELSTNSNAQYLGGNGTVSLPFYSFSADGDNGLYRIGANNVGMSIAGTKLLDYGAATLGLTGALTTSGIISVDDTTTSTSGTTGSIHTDGGIGVAGTAHIVGVTTHGGDILSDTDSTDSIGSTGVRWLKLWVDSIQTTGNTDISGNLTVTGNLTINGTTVTNDATNTEIKDPLIELNSGAGSNANDLGFIFERGSTGNNGFLGWDESGDHFVAATTTATGGSTGNISYAYAPFNCSTITATAGALSGLTSIAMSAGATLTAGFLDEDDMASDSAVAGVTQQSVKAYVGSNLTAPGIQMTWESTTTDTDQGAGKVWANNATLSSATVLYFDDVENNGVSINAFVDSLDNPTATNSATIYIAEGGTGGAGVVFQVSGAVTSASTYSKVAVTHVATYGTLTDADLIGVVVAFSADNGTMNGPGSSTDNAVARFTGTGGATLQNSATLIDDNDLLTAPGGVAFNKGGDIPSASPLVIDTDGGMFDVTGTTGFSAMTVAAKRLFILQFDGVVTLTHGAGTLDLPGNANITTAAGDSMLCYATAANVVRVLSYTSSVMGAASTSAGGTVEVATQVEVNAGTDALRSLAPSTLAGSNYVNAHNFVHNPSFDVAQRGVTFNATSDPLNSDDLYHLDRWYTLSEGNDIVDITKQTDGGVGNRSYIRLDVETASKKFGIAQIMEGSDVHSLLSESQVVSLSFNAKVNNVSAGRMDNIKAGVISWSGTEDAVTSDLIAAWGAEDTTPTLISNATFENTPANLSVTASDTRLKVENISIDQSGVNNLIVFIWCDGLTGTVTDKIEITNVQLEVGAIATAFSPRAYTTELTICQRYFERLGTLTGADNAAIGTGYANDTSSAYCLVPYTRKRIQPTITPFDAAAFRIWYTGGFQGSSAIGTTNGAASLDGVWLDVTAASAALTAGDGLILSGLDSDGTDYLDIIAEL